MISFIVIGRNEGWRLSKCLQSIYESIECNSLKNSEVIYVDSKSTDNSLEIAKSFDYVRLFEITGECNAAIARNIGAKEARGNILFFIDGDMEVEPAFLSEATNEIGDLKYDYVTGHIDDYLYTYENKFLDIQQRTYKGCKPENEQVIPFNGGVFLIRKKIWDEIGGMRTKYKRSQDRDLSIRLIKNNIKIVRLPYLIVKHHTVDYQNEVRMWNNLKEGYILFSSMLIRDHIGNSSLWKKILRAQHSAFTLILVVFCIFLFQDALFQILGIFIALLIARVIRNTYKNKYVKNKLFYFLKRTLYQLLSDFIFLLGILFYFPTSKDIRYKSIKV